MGTSLCPRNLRTACRRRRRSSQWASESMTGSALAAHDGVVAPHRDLELIERPGRRPADVPAGQIETAIVACAPDELQVGTVLHRTLEMGADRGERAEVPGGQAH